LGLVQELVENANVVGALRGKVFGLRGSNDWTLLIIKSVERHGEENVVVAEYLDSLKGETVQFTCFSSDPIFSPGNFVSQKGKEFSFFNPEWLVPVQFVSGSRIARPKEDATSTGALSPKSSLSKAKIDKSLRPTRPRNRQNIAITKSDSRHFQSKKASKEAFCAGLRPVVKKLSKEGIRKPRDVAARLNRDNIATACGASWTPKLVHLLLAYLFESAIEKAKSTSQQSLKGRRKDSKYSPTPPTLKSSGSASKAGRPVQTRPRKTEVSTVKQSFSHGRTKSVIVEKTRRRPLL
jgi:hypothetical protein